MSSSSPIEKIETRHSTSDDNVLTQADLSAIAARIGTLQREKGDLVEQVKLLNHQLGELQSELKIWKSDMLASLSCTHLYHSLSFFFTPKGYVSAKPEGRGTAEMDNDKQRRAQKSV